MNNDIAQHARTRRTKVYAVLAGGLVLGIGAAVTLAAWNDSEFATVDFTSGSFVFQGSEDGTTFSDHASQAGAADLTFSAPFADLSPDDMVYSPYALRLDSSGAAADLSAVAPTVTGALDGFLTFDSVATTSFGCDAAAYAAGTAVPATIADGQTINLCLRVTASSTLPQASTGTAVWQWDAVSQ